MSLIFLGFLRFSFLENESGELDVEDWVWDGGGGGSIILIWFPFPSLCNKFTSNGDVRATLDEAQEVALVLLILLQVSLFRDIASETTATEDEFWAWIRLFVDKEEQAVEDEEEEDEEEEEDDDDDDDEDDDDEDDDEEDEDDDEEGAEEGVEEAEEMVEEEEEQEDEEEIEDEEFEDGEEEEGEEEREGLIADPNLVTLLLKILGLRINCWEKEEVSVEVEQVLVARLGLFKEWERGIKVFSDGALEIDVDTNWPCVGEGRVVTRGNRLDWFGFTLNDCCWIVFKAFVVPCLVCMACCILAKGKGPTFDWDIRLGDAKFFPKFERLTLFLLLQTLALPVSEVIEEADGKADEDNDIEFILDDIKGSGSSLLGAITFGDLNVALSSFEITELCWLKYWAIFLRVTSTLKLLLLLLILLLLLVLVLLLLLFEDELEEKTRGESVFIASSSNEALLQSNEDTDDDSLQFADEAENLSFEVSSLFFPISKSCDSLKLLAIVNVITL